MDEQTSRMLTSGESDHIIRRRDTIISATMLLTGNVWQLDGPEKRG
jgi:hypothetical protein